MDSLCSGICSEIFFDLVYGDPLRRPGRLENEACSVHAVGFPSTVIGSVSCYAALRVFLDFSVLDGGGVSVSRSEHVVMVSVLGFW